MFGTRSLHRIMGYCWDDFGSNKQLLWETELRSYQHGLLVPTPAYGNMARFLKADLAHRALSVRDDLGWKRPI